MHDLSALADASFSPQLATLNFVATINQSAVPMDADYKALYNGNMKRWLERASSLHSLGLLIGKDMRIFSSELGDEKIKLNQLGSLSLQGNEENLSLAPLLRCHWPQVTELILEKIDLIGGALEEFSEKWRNSFPRLERLVLVDWNTMLDESLSVSQFSTLENLGLIGCSMNLSSPEANGVVAEVNNNINNASGVGNATTGCTSIQFSDVKPVPFFLCIDWKVTIIIIEIYVLNTVIIGEFLL